MKRGNGLWGIAAACGLVAGAAVGENPAAAPLVFTGAVKQGVRVEAPSGTAQSFVAWFRAEGEGQGDKPFDRIVQTPDWYLHTLASATEVDSLTFGFTDAKGKIAGCGNLGRTDGICFGQWQHAAVTFGADGFRVYLNGRRILHVPSSRQGTPVRLKGGAACLGNASVGGNRPFCGKIAGATFLPRTLTADEIAALAQTGPDGRPVARPVSTAHPAAADILPVVDISEDASRQVVIAEGTKDRYEGHPTTLLADDGKTVFCVWTTGHGGPCGQMARSDDAGRTWMRLDATLPAVYARTHQNCPVLQKARLANGKTRYFVFSAKVREGTGLGILASDDLGKTWYEAPCQKHLSAGMPPTGFMQLKDGTLALFGQVRKNAAVKSDRPTDDQNVWMSQSSDGGLTWEPARTVATADRRNLCEPCCLRSPDGNELVLLLRENRHKGRSMMCFSRDEGKTWSAPVDTPWPLTGDRHEGVLLPDGRYVIAFRDQAIDSPTHGQFMAWVGTWKDLVEGRPGQYRIHLLHHFGQPGRWPGNPLDTGYPGVELLPDGTILCTTYTRHFDDDRQSSVVMTRFKIAETDALLARMPPAEDPYRPQFHFTPDAGWVNDPNGLSWFNGEWHFFYQHNPSDVKWGNLHWGHAVSRNLFRWRELGEALAPDESGAMFSGSAVVDPSGTAGFGAGAQILFYTAAGKPFTQGLAWSTDGRTYRKGACNPIVKAMSAQNRDPKVFWHDGVRAWVMALYGEENGRHAVWILNSPDLKEWKKVSTVFGGDVKDKSDRWLYECPGLEEVPIEGERGKAWVLWGADCNYAVGSFDGKVFRPEGIRIPGLRFPGKQAAYYAGQTFSNVPDGRVIWTAWYRMPRIAGERFTHTFALPQELTLRRLPEGLRLVRRPAREYVSLRAGATVALEAFDGELAEIDLAATLAPEGRLAFDLRGIPVSYDAKRGVLSVAGEDCPWQRDGNRFAVKVFLDRRGLEVFSADGLQMAAFGSPRASRVRRTLSVLEQSGASDCRFRATPIASVFAK